MSQSLSKVVVHLVFSTKHRSNFIKPDIEEKFHAYLSGICKEYDSPSIVINGMPDHVHVLFVQSKNYALAKLVEEIKRGSSKWIKTQGQDYKEFYWQGGYASFSVSESQIARVKLYIRDQKEHHKKMSFQDELRILLKKHRMEYDEQYVWD